MATPASLRIAEGGFRVYKHTWRASLFSSFLNPILLLTAMGIGLGSLVREGPGGLDYVMWLAPGLVANIAMQTATGESAYPVQAGIRWTKVYDAMLAGPLTTIDILMGHLAWVTVRVVIVTATFSAATVLLAHIDPLRAALAMIPAVLTGMAFVGPVTGYTARFNNDTSLSTLFRYIVVPLFLFSGVFFPISQLPALIQPLAWITPLWNGVELTRWAAVGIPTTFPWGVHLAALVVVGVAGFAYANRWLHKRLVK